MSLTIIDLEKNLQWLADNHGKGGVPEYAYVEVGRYKPYHPSIVGAAERRGYRVERLGSSSYAVYPKLAEQPVAEPVAEAMPTLDFSLTFTGTVAPDGGDDEGRNFALTAGELRHNLHVVIERALSEAIVTGNTPATLEAHETRVVVFESGYDYAPARGLEVVAEIESARPLKFGHVAIQTGDRLCRLRDAVASVEAAAAGDWIPGAPPRGVEAAWLRTATATPEGQVENAVLGICDSSGVWCGAGRWQADDALDPVEGEITHWMPYVIPSPHFDVAARPEKPLEQLRAEVEAGLAELMRRADEPMAINYGPNVYMEVCPIKQYGERLAVCHREYGWTSVNYSSEGLILDVFGQHDLESRQSLAFDSAELTQDEEDEEQDDVKDWGKESVYRITFTDADGAAVVDTFRAENAWGAELMCRGRYPGCEIAETVLA